MVYFIFIRLLSDFLFNYVVLFKSILEMFILELFPEAHVKKQLMQTTTGF